MAFVKFMRNKFFHPHTFENQKRTWIAEQKHAAEKKRQEDLHKQYIKEQAIYENKNLLKHGKITQDDKLTFMYEPPLECRKKDEKMELREVRFEWQKNAPRAGEYARQLEVADQPFGIEVRNTKCIKCGVWGHANADRVCPLYFSNTIQGENPDLGKQDPMSLISSMEEGGLKMRKDALNKVVDVHDNKYKIIADDVVDPEVAFIAGLTDKQKRKLMKKLNRQNSGPSGGVAKKKKKKEKKSKKSKKEKAEVVEDRPPPKNKHRAPRPSGEEEQRKQSPTRKRNDSPQPRTIRVARRRTDSGKNTTPPRRRHDSGRKSDVRREERSLSPNRRESYKRKLSPPASSSDRRRESSPKRRRRSDLSPDQISPDASPTPDKRRKRSPTPDKRIKRSPTPEKRKSRRSPTPEKRKKRSPTPEKRRRRSPSPEKRRRRSPSPEKESRRNPTPEMRTSRRSPSPENQRQRNRTPKRRARKNSSSPEKQLRRRTPEKRRSSPKQGGSRRHDTPDSNSSQSSDSD